VSQGNGGRRVVPPGRVGSVARRVRWSSMWFLGSAILFLAAALVPSVPGAGLIFIAGGAGMFIAGVLALVGAFRERGRVRRRLGIR
jgi:hypothetical protein